MLYLSRLYQRHDNAAQVTIGINFSIIIICMQPSPKQPSARLFAALKTEVKWLVLLVHLSDRYESSPINNHCTNKWYSSDYCQHGRLLYFIFHFLKWSLLASCHHERAQGREPALLSSNSSCLVRNLASWLSSPFLRTSTDNEAGESAVGKVDLQPKKFFVPG